MERHDMRRKCPHLAVRAAMRAKMQIVKSSRTDVGVYCIVVRLTAYDTIRYDTRCYFNVCSKANMSQLNLPHGDN